MEQSFLLYRSIRQRVSRLLDDVRLAGYNQVYIQGDGDIADICRLTCLEQGMAMISTETAPGHAEGLPFDHTPVIEVRGLRVVLHIDKEL